VQCSVCRVNIDPCCGGAALYCDARLETKGSEDQSAGDLNSITNAENAGV